MSDRKGLADRLERYLSERAKMSQMDPESIHGLHIGDDREAVLSVADVRQAAAALRQEPSVEEVLRAFVDDMLNGYGVNHTSKFVRDKAQAIAAMYRGEDA